MTLKATDIKLIKLEDEILVGYKGHNSTYFYCPKCKKEVDMLYQRFDENGDSHLDCSCCNTPVEWKESKEKSKQIRKNK